MTSIHEMLLNKKRLWNWANAVVKNDYWQEFVAYAKAHVLNSRQMSSESQRGVIAICEAFEELTQPADVDDKPVAETYGLRHDLDIDRTKSKPAKDTE